MVTSFIYHTITLLTGNSIIWVAIGSILFIFWTYFYAIKSLVPPRHVIIARDTILSITQNGICIIEHTIWLRSSKIAKASHIVKARNLILCVTLGYIYKIDLVTCRAQISIWIIAILPIILMAYNSIICLAICGITSFNFQLIRSNTVNSILSQTYKLVQTRIWWRRCRV